MYPPILRVHLKTDQRKTYILLFNNAYAMFGVVFFFLLIIFIKAYVVGTHLSCIDKGTHNICLYKEVDRKYTDCNLKTME